MSTYLPTQSSPFYAFLSTLHCFLAPGQPNNYKKNQHCLYMDKKNNKWNDETCSKLHYFICAYHSDDYRPELESKKFWKPKIMINKT